MFNSQAQYEGGIGDDIRKKIEIVGITLVEEAIDAVIRWDLEIQRKSAAILWFRC